MTRTWRCRLLLLAVAALAVIAGGWLGTDIYPDLVKVHIDKAAFDRIRPGMRLHHVESTIGVPPGDYDLVSERIRIVTKITDDDLVSFTKEYEAGCESEVHAWYGSEGVIR